MPMPIDRVTYSCRADLGKEPSLLKGARLTLLVVAILAVIAGILSLAGVPYISHLGHIGGYISVSIGAFVAFICSLFKGVKSSAPRQDLASNLLTDNTMVTTTNATTNDSNTKRKTKESKEPIVSVYSNEGMRSTILGELPSWLANAVPMDIPILKCQGKDLDLKKVVEEVSSITEGKSNICLLGGDLKGLYLKVQIQHINVSRECEAFYQQLDTRNTASLPPSKEPFIAHIIIQNQIVQRQFLDSKHEIRIHTEAPALWHRNRADAMDNFLGVLRATNAEVDFGNLAKNYKKQDDLPYEAQDSQEWFLLRLLQQESAKVKEWWQKVAYPSMSPSMIVGYWHVSLA